jgi:DNA-binding IclR family transcriptional regulator
VTVRLGYGRPALEANSGLLILAFQSQARRQSLMRDAEPEDRERLGSAAFLNVFAEIRSSGHRVAPSRDIMAVTDIACPVIGPAGHAEAAILVPALRRHGFVTDELAIVLALTAVCSEAGAQLSL